MTGPLFLLSLCLQESAVQGKSAMLNGDVSMDSNEEDELIISDVAVDRPHGLLDAAAEDMLTIQGEAKIMIRVSQKSCHIYQYFSKIQPPTEPQDCHCSVGGLIF